ncbi:MAG TPA: hypothetical protein VFG91_05000 [Woeseiaceae bacterium]|nr:hypothetical protein [Woeseiaceae bacterium]
MFKALRIAVLLLILVTVSLSTWLTQARSTDWNNSLWAKVYPINADGSAATQRYIDSLELGDFASIETFIAREAQKFGHGLEQPLRMELGPQIAAQPPALPASPGILQVMGWSLGMRWWAASVTDDRIAPDVRIFVRYHQPRDGLRLEDSVGMQKGMVGVVNAWAGRRHAPVNDVIIAHELLHTLGATDKYDPATGLPSFPDGYAEPERSPLYPQRYAEIMGGRIPVSESEAMIPQALRYAVIGPATAREIRLLE